MKIDGDKFMEWLHQIRRQEAAEEKRIGYKRKQIKDQKIVQSLIEQYHIPVVKN